MNPSEAEKTSDTGLPETVSCFGVIIENGQFPKRIYLVHNHADPLGPYGEEGKPEGWGLPGGGSLEDEKPDETVIREVLAEAGLLTEVRTRRTDSEFGEILREYKLHVNNTVYIFDLARKGSEGFHNIEETGETGRVMLADLASILKMPLAIKIIRNEDGEQEKVRNPEGIYFSSRERIFGVLEYLDYDFYQLIPDLDKLIGEIKQEEVGNYVYNLLSAVVSKKNEINEKRAKFLRPDDDELLERYAEWIK